MIPFEKAAGRWKGGGFLRRSDQEFADCERSVMGGALAHDGKPTGDAIAINAGCLEIARPSSDKS
jgi:hypothetical protein